MDSVSAFAGRRREGGLARRFKLACCIALSIASLLIHVDVAPAQQFPTKDISVRRGRITKLHSSVSSETPISWLYLGSAECDLIPDSDSKTAIFFAPRPEPGDSTPPNEFSILCLGAVTQTNKEGKTIPFVVGVLYRIKVTDPSPPTPPPIPPPIPPPSPPVPPDPKPSPADPVLTQKFKAAIDQDIKSGLGTVAQASTLATVYTETANLLEGVQDPNIRPKTWADLVARTVNASVAKKVPRQPYLQSVRLVCSEILGSHQDETQLDATRMADAIARYRKIGINLSEASK